MPKDKKEEVKKKLVVVEEVEATDEQDNSNTEEMVSSKEVESGVEKPVIEEKVEEEKMEEDIKETSEEKPQTTVKAEYQDESDPVFEEKPNYLWIIIPTALLVGGLVGGLITYFSGISRLSAETPTSTPLATYMPQVTPTEAPKTSIKREDLKVQILNGSGVSGAANKAKTFLEGLGYKGVEVGNASSSDFAETEVSIKDSKKEFLSTLTTDLSKNYTVSKETKTLAASSKYDIVITLGKK